MKFMITGRQGGKTHAAAEWVKANPGAVMITASRAAADHLILDYGLDPQQVIPWNSAARLRGRHVTVGIDNLDIILRELLGREVEFVTATGAIAARPRHETPSTS